MKVLAFIVRGGNYFVLKSKKEVSVLRVNGFFYRVLELFLFFFCLELGEKNVSVY